MSACEEDDGRPSPHVIRFHEIAPMSAASTSTSPGVPLGALMMPSPTVAAIPVPMKAPTKLKNAAIRSATRGVSARVEIEVAMAFAASWNPLV